MRKLSSLLALFVFVAFTSCEDNTLADQEELYIDSPDTDDFPELPPPPPTKKDS